MFKYFLLLISLAVASASAEIVELNWRDAANAVPVARSFTIAPKKVLEICATVQAGDAITWSFEAERETSFNVHTHRGKEVVFAVPEQRSASARGSTRIATSDTHCWMWTNPTSTSTSVSVSMTRATANSQLPPPN